MLYSPSDIYGLEEGHGCFEGDLQTDSADSFQMDAASPGAVLWKNYQTSLQALATVGGAVFKQALSSASSVFKQALSSASAVTQACRQGARPHARACN